MTEKVESSDKNGRLYDKAGKVRKIRHEQKEADGEGKLSKVLLSYRNFKKIKGPINMLKIHYDDTPERF